MKRFVPMALGLLVLAVLVAVPVYRLSAAGPAGAPAGAGARWEYAELRLGRTENSCVFTTADFQATTSGAAELLAKIGGKGVTADEIKKDPTLYQRTSLMVFDQLGSQGWELVSVAPEGPWGADASPDGTHFGQPNYSRVYLFKRPAAK